jgi:hypothetical protein
MMESKTHEHLIDIAKWQYGKSRRGVGGPGNDRAGHSPFY